MSGARCHRRHVCPHASDLLAHGDDYYGETVNDASSAAFGGRPGGYATAASSGGSYGGLNWVRLGLLHHGLASVGDSLRRPARTPKETASSTQSC